MLTKLLELPEQELFATMNFLGFLDATMLPLKTTRTEVKEYTEMFLNWKWRMGGFQEGGFQIVECAAFSSRGNLLLQGNFYLKSTLRLLLRRRV